MNKNTRDSHLNILLRAILNDAINGYSINPGVLEGTLLYKFNPYERS